MTVETGSEGRSASLRSRSSFSVVSNFGLPSLAECFSGSCFRPAEKRQRATSSTTSPSIPSVKGKSIQEGYRGELGNCGVETELRVATSSFTFSVGILSGRSPTQHKEAGKKAKPLIIGSVKKSGRSNLPYLIACSVEASRESEPRC